MTDEWKPPRLPRKTKYIILDIETTGFRPWYGDRITCICAKDSDGNTFGRVNLNEWRIMGGFLDWLEERKPREYFLVTKNGKEFDTGFILSRIAVKQIEMLPFAKILLDYEHFDLQDITSRRIGLQQMSELLGCASKSGNGEVPVPPFPQHLLPT